LLEAEPAAPLNTDATFRAFYIQSCSKVLGEIFRGKKRQWRRPGEGVPVPYFRESWGVVRISLATKKYARNVSEIPARFLFSKRNQVETWGELKKESGASLPKKTLGRWTTRRNRRKVKLTKHKCLYFPNSKERKGIRLSKVDAGSPTTTS